MVTSFRSYRGQRGKPGVLYHPLPDSLHTGYFTEAGARLGQQTQAYLRHHPERGQCLPEKSGGEALLLRAIWEGRNKPRDL